MSNAILQQLTDARIETGIIEPGKPWQNGTNESVNAEFRDECLSVARLRTRREAQVIIEAWRQYYNAVRPHPSLDYLTPSEFQQQHPSIHGHPNRAIPRDGLHPNPGLRSDVANMNSFLYSLLQPHRLTEVVDIGANPIDGDPPYKPMLDAGLCRVTGFEPQKEALADLQRKQGQNERYLNYVVGDGSVHTFNICRGSGMSSLFEPDPVTFGLFGVLQPLSDVMRQEEVQTRRLDEIDEIRCLDFLKIDIQGGELAVFRSGAGKLGSAVVIQTEVSFITLYKHQPSLGDIDIELRNQGFVPHCFEDVKTWPIAPCIINRDPTRALNQLLEADIVYVRDFSRPERMSDEQLKHLALIAHHCYKSFDLALRCVMLLEQRGALGAGMQQQYLTSLTSKG